MTKTTSTNVYDALARRFSDAPELKDQFQDHGTLLSMAQRGSCRSFQPTAIPTALLETLSAVALSAPTKSDLQQRDIVLLTDGSTLDRLATLVEGQTWVAQTPAIAVFCGNNRRQRQLHDWAKVPFANDHLDAFFNASVDAAIALGAFVTAAEAIGLGCCPISAIRNHPEDVSNLLGLPEHVFPVAGLAIGYPAEEITVSKRLPLKATVHHGTFNETEIKSTVASYDVMRQRAQPYATQRFTSDFGDADAYTWSDDKIRQYSKPERDNFGTFIKAKGFKLE